MSVYVDNEGNYPRYDGDLSLAHPDWEPGSPVPQGWLLVAELEPPTSTESTYVYEEFPIMVEEVLTQNWISRPLTEEELLEVSMANSPLLPYLAPGVSEESLGITSS